MHKICILSLVEFDCHYLQWAWDNSQNFIKKNLEFIYYSYRENYCHSKMFIINSNSMITTAVILLLLCQSSHSRINTVAVFRRDEVDYHKYSAILGAIEPCRMQLQDDIKKSLNPMNYIFHKIKGQLCIKKCSTKRIHLYLYAE